MPRHASFSSRLHRSDRRVSRARGVPDFGVAQPGADRDAYGGVYLNVDVYADGDGNENGNRNANTGAHGNGCAYGDTNGFGSVNVGENGNVNGNTLADALADANSTPLGDPISGRPIVCSCRRLGRVAD